MAKVRTAAPAPEGWRPPPPRRKLTMVCVIAYQEPPAKWGFKPTHNGRAWWIRLSPPRAARCLLALAERHIRATSFATASRSRTRILEPRPLPPTPSRANPPSPKG